MHDGPIASMEISGLIPSVPSSRRVEAGRVHCGFGVALGGTGAAGMEPCAGRGRTAAGASRGTRGCYCPRHGTVDRIDGEGAQGP